MFLGLLKRLLSRQPNQVWKRGALLSIARTALNDNDFAVAIRAVDAVISTDPYHAEALYYRGLVAYHREDYAAALVAFRAARGSAPTNPDYAFQVAACHIRLGDISSAIQSCQIAMEQHPLDPRPYLLMAQINLPGPVYTDVLAAIHHHLAPRTYLEIGVESGKTLVLAGKDTVAVGVDPAPAIRYSLGANARVHALASDEFFERVDVTAEFGGLPIDLAFIDGMHLFEYALRDFAMIERYCSPQSTILIHDCYPLDRRSAERDRVTAFWSGDVWRLLLLLKKYRSDLAIGTIAAAPTGLAVVRRLNPESRFLGEHMDEIIEEYLGIDYSFLIDDKPGKLSLIPNEWPHVAQLLR